MPYTVIFVCLYMIGILPNQVYLLLHSFLLPSLINHLFTISICCLTDSS